MEIFTFIPVVGSLIMLYESVRGQMISGKKLSPMGKIWIRNGALLGLSLDWTIVGGAIVRLGFRLPIYLRSKKSPLLKKQDDVSATANIEQAGELENQAIIEQRTEEMRVIMANQDEEEQIVTMQKLEKESESDKNSRVIYEKLRNERYAGKGKGVTSNKVDKSKESGGASPINPKSIPSQKPLSRNVQPEQKQAPKPFIPGNMYKKPIFKRPENKSREGEKELEKKAEEKNKENQQKLIETTKKLEEKSDTGFADLIKKTLKHKV